jgi:thioesterase domain-containing protein
VPSLIGVLLDEDSGDPARYTSCRLWISSGEPLPAALADRLAAVLPGSRLYNLYGCTEVSGDSLAAECRPGGELPLGRPLQNTRCYVLDQDLRPVPEGRAGELYLAGAGVARGYQGRPRATSERFVADPFGVPGARMYRTGDLVRRKPGGDLEYLGRTDAQVKIRGMRVEPAEVESELLRDTSVARAVVASRRETLVAYVCPVPGEDPDPAALRDAAAARLPEHLVPRAVVVLDALPALPNGKIDRAALPEPGPAALNGRAPSTPHQDLLCELFAEVLGLPKVGVDDDFFELGGHSLTATRLAGRIRSALGATVSPRSLFTAPTPARLAARLGLGTRDDAFEVLLPLRTTGTAPPLFCVHPAGGLAWCYAGLLRHLGADQPVYGVQAHGLTQPARSPATVGEMAAAYVEEIRTVAPDGPYRLLGWSFGGAVAHAMATLLQEGGERVELLAFMDAYPREGLPETGELDQDTVLRLLLSDYFGITAPADGPLDPGRTARLLDEAGQVSFGAADLTAIAGLLAANSRLVREFTPRTFKGDLVFFRARFGWDGDGPSSALWTPYVTGEVVEHPISCTHGTMARPGPLAEVGRLLTTTTKGISQP